MKMDRNLTKDGSGKYALINMRAVRAVDTRGNVAETEIARAIEVLDEYGVIDWGNKGASDEFFVIKLKDKYAEQALVAYAVAAQDTENTGARAPSMTMAPEKVEELVQATLPAQAAMGPAVTQAWQPMWAAPKGEPTDDVGCSGHSRWFLGKVSEHYRRGNPPYIVIRRRSWPNQGSWHCAGDADYVPNFFEAWCELPEIAAASLTAGPVADQPGGQLEALDLDQFKGHSEGPWDYVASTEHHGPYVAAASGPSTAS